MVLVPLAQVLLLPVLVHGAVVHSVDALHAQYG